MKQHTLKICRVTDRKTDQQVTDAPVYVLTNGMFFRTAFHPDGWSDKPDYDLGNDGRIYRTANHPKGISQDPDYRFGKDRRLYRTMDHPDGALETAEFEIFD